jgi:hypothetical protein
LELQLAAAPNCAARWHQLHHSSLCPTVLRRRAEQGGKRHEHVQALCNVNKSTRR